MKQMQKGISLFKFKFVQYYADFGLRIFSVSLGLQIFTTCFESYPGIGFNLFSEILETKEAMDNIRGSFSVCAYDRKKVPLMVLMIIMIVMMVILMIMMTKNIQISLVLSKNVPILGTFSW